MPRTLLIDTDTASDDAVALIMALRSPERRVAAITVVAGNIPVQQATSNALYTAELCGFRRAHLLRRGQAAATQAGLRGLVSRSGRPRRSRLCAPPSAAREPRHAVDASARGRARQSRHRDRHARTAHQPRASLITRTSARRFHQALHHHGRRALLRRQRNAGRGVQHLGRSRSSSHRVSFRHAHRNGWLASLPRSRRRSTRKKSTQLLALKSPLADFAIRCNSTAAEAYFKQTGERGISLPDPVAMGIALNPSLCTSSSEHFVDIATSSDLTRGATVVDRLNVAGDSRNRDVWAETIAAQPRKIHVCWNLNIPAWKRQRTSPHSARQTSG